MSLNEPKKNFYRVREGDTWTSIAERFRLSAEDLAGANARLPTSSLAPGELIEIPPEVEQKLVLSVRKNLLRLRDLNRRLLTDAGFRRDFLADPVRVLSDAGVEVPPGMVPADFQVLKILDDQKFKQVVGTGDHKAIREYIAAEYPDLVGDVRGPAQVSDAVEAVAVAVVAPAVAVADPIC